MYFLSAGAGKTVSGLTPAAPIAALQSVCLFLRRLDLLDLDLAQIQRIQTRIHGIGGLDKLGVGCAGGQGVRREAVPCLGLLFRSFTASGTMSGLPLALRRPMTISAAATMTDPIATSWLARRPVLPISSESVRSPSIQARPRPYQMI